tara:strand:+ start:14937 stop:15404 length:468 start_codon:yes stop_codon:yes gene_type:complete
MAERTTTNYRGMPAGRNYLVSILKFSNVSGTESSEWMVDEIFKGQGYSQGVPVLNDLDEGTLQITFAAPLTPSEWWDSMSVAGYKSPISLYSASGTWLSGQEAGPAADEGWVPWFLNSEESLNTGLNIYAQGVDGAIGDGVAQAELEFRFYPTLQ